MKWLGLDCQKDNTSWMLFDMDKVFAIMVSDTCLDIYPKGEELCCRIEIISEKNILSSSYNSWALKLIDPEDMLSIKEEITNPDNYDKIFPKSFFRVDDPKTGIHAFFNRDLIKRISYHTGFDCDEYKIHFSGKHGFSIPGELVEKDLMRNIAERTYNDDNRFKEPSVQPLAYLDFIKDDELSERLQRIPEYIVSDPSLPTGIAFDLRMVHILLLEILKDNVLKVTPKIESFYWALSGKISPNQSYYKQLLDIRNNAFLILV